MTSRLHAVVVLENSGGGSWTFPRGSFGLDQPDGSVYCNVEPISLGPWTGDTRPKQTVKFERMSTRESAGTIGDGAKNAFKFGVNVESFTVLGQTDVKNALAKNIRFDANNLPSFTGDARCSMIERALAKYEEKNGKLSVKKKRRFIEAATLAMHEYESAIEDVLMGRAFLFNGDGIIPSPAKMREARNDRVSIG